MRTIKFRGKRTDNGSWETGGVAPLWINTNRENWCIVDMITGFITPVITETVGQFIGMTDKNGKEIYEGDLILCKYWNNETGIIVYDDVKSSYRVKWLTFAAMRKDRISIRAKIEVIGNIHDNPELLTTKQ